MFQLKFSMLANRDVDPVFVIIVGFCNKVRFVLGEFFEDYIMQVVRSQSESVGHMHNSINEI